MSDFVILMNDVEALYHQPIIETDKGFACPVCGKDYVNKKRLETHIEKMNCYKMQDVFKDTEYEKQAQELYRSVIIDQNPKARINMANFRKSKMYGGFLRFVLFGANHQILDKGLYFSWLMYIKEFKLIQMTLSRALDENNLREYRRFLQNHPKYIDSATFMERYADALAEDPHFLVRSVEKGHVAIKYMISNKKYADRFADVIEKLPPDYWNRICGMLDE